MYENEPEIEFVEQANENDIELINFFVSHIKLGHSRNDSKYIEQWLPYDNGKLFIAIGKEITKLNDDKLTNFVRKIYKERYFV